MINVEIRLSEARAHRLWGYRKYQMNRIQLGGTDRNRMTSGYNSSPIQMQIKYVLIKVTYIFNNTCTPKSANFNGVRAITLSARPNLTRKLLKTNADTARDSKRPQRTRPLLLP
jgi:hypothetical protein